MKISNRSPADFADAGRFSSEECLVEPKMPVHPLSRIASMGEASFQQL